MQLCAECLRSIDFGRLTLLLWVTRRHVTTRAPVRGLAVGTRSHTAKLHLVSESPASCGCFPTVSVPITVMAPPRSLSRKLRVGKSPREPGRAGSRECPEPGSFVRRCGGKMHIKVQEPGPDWTQPLLTQHALHTSRVQFGLHQNPPGPLKASLTLR